MIYSRNNTTDSNIILSEVAKFQPSTTVPSSLKKTVIGICNNILNKSRKLDREDAKVDHALKAIEGAIALAKDNSYTDNAYPVEIHSVITNGEACMDYAVYVVRTMGFKHSNMKEGKKGQTWYKVFGNDIIVASLIGTLFGNNMVTIILHAVENSDHNNDILNGILESTVLTEGQQAEDYKARKFKESEDSKDKDNQRFYHRHAKSNYGNTKKSSFEDTERAIDASTMEKKDYNRRFFNHITTKYGDDTQKARQREKELLTAAKSGEREDAINRHMRRHPKQYKEGTIFESVEFI